MNPLHLLILVGREDERLLEHISNLEQMEKVGDLSAGEQVTYNLCLRRLEEITRPDEV